MIKIRHTIAIELRSTCVSHSKSGAIALKIGFKQANIKLEQYGYAIADATKAIELDSKYAKVHHMANAGVSFITSHRLTIGERSLTLPYFKLETL